MDVPLRVLKPCSLLAEFVQKGFVRRGLVVFLFKNLDSWLPLTVQLDGVSHFGWVWLHVFEFFEALLFHTTCCSRGIALVRPDTKSAGNVHVPRNTTIREKLLLSGPTANGWIRVDELLTIQIVVIERVVADLGDAFQFSDLAGLRSRLPLSEPFLRGFTLSIAGVDGFIDLTIL